MCTAGPSLLLGVGSWKIRYHPQTPRVASTRYTCQHRALADLLGWQTGGLKASSLGCGDYREDGCRVLSQRRLLNCVGADL